MLLILKFHAPGLVFLRVVANVCYKSDELKVKNGGTLQRICNPLAWYNLRIANPLELVLSIQRHAELVSASHYQGIPNQVRDHDTIPRCKRGIAGT